MENHHFQWENPLFQWPFSIAKSSKLPEATTSDHLRSSVQEERQRKAQERAEAERKREEALQPQTAGWSEDNEDQVAIDLCTRSDDAKKTQETRNHKKKT